MAGMMTIGEILQQGHSSPVSQQQIEQCTRQFRERIARGVGDNTCWLWTGKSERRNHQRPFGVFKLNETVYRVENIMWMLTEGEIFRYAVVVQRCGNPLCVKPKHLLLRQFSTWKERKAYIHSLDQQYLAKQNQQE